MKKEKTLLIVGIFLLLIIGVTFAYFETSLTSIQALADWNTTNVTNMSYMFSECQSITTLQELSGWDVSNVTDMRTMFQNCIALTDASAINDWNINSVTFINNFSIEYNYFWYMFKGCSVHSTFTQRSGYWNSFFPLYHIHKLRRNSKFFYKKKEIELFSGIYIVKGGFRY